MFTEKIMPGLMDFDYVEDGKSLQHEASTCDDPDTSMDATTSEFDFNTQEVRESLLDVDHPVEERGPLVLYDVEAWRERIVPLSPSPFRLRKPRSRLVMILDDTRVDPL
jgi:hypothetical protein